MNDWDATSYAAKENLLRVLRREADALFEMAGNGPWTGKTACTEWETRDIVGHLIDVTESYFVGFDAARSGAAVGDPLGVRVMQDRLDESAKEHRGLSQAEAVDRLRTDFGKMMEICEALGPDEWGGLLVPHKYMGPLPAFFYPVFQLMDYGVHGWDIRQGSGRAHSLLGDTGSARAVHVHLVAGHHGGSGRSDAYAVGVRLSGRNAQDYLVNVTVDGLSYAQEDVSGLPAVIEFDAGTLVLTAFGRVNAGAIGAIGPWPTSSSTRSSGSDGVS